MRDFYRRAAVLEIQSMEHIGHSPRGNPRFRIGFTDGTGATTAPNALVAYGLPDPAFTGVPVKVTFNRANQILDIEVSR